MKNLGIFIDNINNKKVAAFLDGDDYLTIPASSEEMEDVIITSESGMWDKKSFQRRFRNA